jgi:peroxiredoxin Q/BCP
MSKKLKSGMKVPSFKGRLQDEREISAKALKGQKYVLYFYPADDTPTCTKQACNLRDNYQKFKAAGYEIFGVSPDGAKSHIKFIKKYELPFSLIADEDKVMCEQFGVWGEKTNFGRTYMGVIRTTFVIDEHGVISEVIDAVKSGEHTQQILHV